MSLKTLLVQGTATLLMAVLWTSQSKIPRRVPWDWETKGYQLKLHIDFSVTVVAQKMRRVPFLLKDKETAKVKKDIIAKVEVPTTWVSPDVPDQKSSGDIRLICDDMRRVTEAIIRERLPIPTIDEVLASVNGSAVFSKLDLAWSFNQI